VLVGSGGFGRKVTWLLRAISIPVLGNIVYQTLINDDMGITKHLFHRPPDILEELLPEMNRMGQLPGARTAVLRSIRSNITLRGVRKHGYILERLKGSEVPLMTIWGAEDKIIPVRHTEDVRRELPHSIVQVIPECGHWPQMEKPLVFNTLLIYFLDGENPQPGQQAS